MATEPWGPRRPRRRWLRVALGLACVGAALAGLALAFPEALADSNSRLNLVQGAAILALVLSGTAAAGSLARGARHALAWAAFGAALVLVYGFREDVAHLWQRFRGELLPATPLVAADGSVRVRANRGGQFVVTATVDQGEVRFLVDTGASDVVLTRRDARRIGLDPDRLAYSGRFRTAGGEVRAAPVQLGAIAIGPLRVSGIRAWVNDEDMPYSLLGTSFLGRLSGYAVSGDTLTLRP